MPESLDKKFEINFRKSLGEVIKAAFPKQDHLAAMVEYELYESLDDITFNEPDYKIAIRKLIQWAQTEGKLCDLVIGAARQKPGNPRLNQFTTENLKNLLILDRNPESAIKDLLDSLIVCLRTVVNFEEVVLPACNQISPDIEKHHPNLSENLSNPELSNYIKWLTVLNFFLKVYSGQNSKGEYYLISFIQKLQELTPNANLIEWMGKLPTALQPKLIPKISGSTGVTLETEQLKSIDAVFVISIEYPEATAKARDDQFTVQAYLLFSPNKETKPFSIQQVPLGLPRDSDSITGSKISPSTVSILATIEEVKGSLAEWVKHVEKLAEDKCFDLKTEHGLSSLPSYSLKIEFWLPFNVILAPVDRWERYKPVSRWRTGESTDKQPIGERHPIVVRSYDRFFENDPFNQLNSAWQSIQDFWSGQPDVETIKQKIKDIKNLNCYDLIRTDSIQSVFGLAIACAISEANYKTEGEDLFDWIFTNGIPVIFWSRDVEAANLDQAMASLLDIEDFSSLACLVDKVTEMRKTANDQNALGRNLSLWFDEIQPFVALKEFQRESKVALQQHSSSF